MLLRAEHIEKSFLDDKILDDVSLSLDDDARCGLLGPNGAGKTTLLNILAGRLSPDAGEIWRAKNLTVGYLRQNDALDATSTLQAEAESAFADVYQAQQALDEAARHLARQPDDTALLQEYDRQLANFEALDGYHVEDKINRVLNGLGFADFDRDTRVSTLSGGEKMRFSFAKLLLQRPRLLLLDEPTNHLDFSMLGWLEEYLAGYKGAVLVVSHDRYFLNAVAKDICEIENHRLSAYHGGYSSFLVQKEERVKTQQRSYEKQQEEIAKMEDYVRRNMARASTSGMAKSRQKTLDKMERLERPPSLGKNIAMRFDYDVEPFETVLECRRLGVEVGEGTERKRLYEELDLTVHRGEKIALVGMNGVGKSTFLKAVQDQVPHDGTARWGGNVRLGYFDQELSGLPMDESVLEAVHRVYPAKTEFEIRSLLGRLLLEGETVFKKVRELSGAMRAKVAFAILELRRANVLLLDEPTNHLDYKAKEVLEQALARFTGTLLVVSHDRYFLQRVPTAILEMRPEGFVRYDGNYDVYAEKRQQAPPQKAADTAARQPQEPKEKPAAGGKRSKQQRALDAQRRQRLAALEKQIAELEADIDAGNIALAAPENASDYELLAEQSERLRENTAALDIAMEEWLALSAEQEQSLPNEE